MALAREVMATTAPALRRLGEVGTTTCSGRAGSKPSLARPAATNSARPERTWSRGRPPPVPRTKRAWVRQWRSSVPRISMGGLPSWVPARRHRASNDVRVHAVPCGQHAPRSASPAALRLRLRTSRSRVRSVVGSRRALLGAASGGLKRLAGRAFWGRERAPNDNPGASTVNHGFFAPC
jgi:hypothetical protein